MKVVGKQQKYFPKWSFNGDLPWQKAKNHLEQKEVSKSSWRQPQFETYSSWKRIFFSRPAQILPANSFFRATHTKATSSKTPMQWKKTFLGMESKLFKTHTHTQSYTKNTSILFMAQVFVVKSITCSQKLSSNTIIPKDCNSIARLCQLRTSESLGVGIFPPGKSRWGLGGGMRLQNLHDNTTYGN